MNRGQLIRRAAPVAGTVAVAAGLAIAVTACSAGNSARAAEPATAHSQAAGDQGPAAASATKAPARPAASATGSASPSASTAPSASTGPAGAPASSAPSGPGTGSASSAGAQSAHSAAPGPVTSTASGPGTYVLWDCTGTAEVEPSSYVLTCADGNTVLEAMHWSSWQPGEAAGSGTLAENDCTPDCADGKTIDYPVSVTLTGSRFYSQAGKYTYPSITMHFPDAAPAEYSTVDGKTTVTYPDTVTWATGSVPPSS